MSRLMVEECFKWAMQRKIFGKRCLFASPTRRCRCVAHHPSFCFVCWARLIDQPVIRFKLSQMAADVESVHSMLEDVTHQMNCMLREGKPNLIASVLAGPIALLKYKQTRVAQLCADNACQILGGRALTRSGMGVMVEKFQRSQKMQAILGGSEEILADFAMRQAMKAFPPEAHL